MKPFLGLRTVLYAVDDLDRAKAWYTSVLGQEPYFAEPFYVGFNVGGFELGLDPNAENRPGAGGTVAYWGVEDIDAVHARLLELGARENGPIQDVGGDIRVATVLDPFDNVFGIIRNPHFQLPPG
jgi:predicted enzyme related to lactoylglutathione lyase